MQTNTFKKNFISVLTGNSIAQLLLLLAMPLLTRLFSPEYFGLAAIFSALLQLTGAVATWRFDWLIPNSRSLHSAAAKMACGLFALTITTALVIPITHAITNQISSNNLLEQLGNLVLLLPIAIAGQGVHKLLQAWFIRESNLVPVSKTKIAQTIGYIGTALVAYMLGLEQAALVLAVTLSGWFGASILINNAKPVLKQLRNLRPSRIKWVFLKNFKLASISTAVSLLNSVSSTFAVLALSLTYSAVQVGLYSLVLRLIATPLSVVSTALTQSFWSRASELARKSDYAQLKDSYVRMTSYLFASSLIVAIGCAIVSFFIAPTLGDAWSGTGPVLRAMIPTFIGLITFTPTNHLVVLNSQSLQSIADLTRLVLIASATVAAYLNDTSFTTAVFLISCSSCIGHSVIFLVHLACYRRLLQKTPTLSN